MAEGLLPDRVDRYLESLVPARPAELAEMEAIGRRIHFPIVGPACGQACYLLARMIGARTVFEMGSGYGYSTAWFARAVHENGGGKVYHVVWDNVLSAQARRHLEVLGFAPWMEYRVGEAIEILRGTPGPFDLIFLDIDKEAYPEALPVVGDKLRQGGILIADNALRRGNVADGRDRSPSTEAIRRFTQMVVGDPAWISTVLPIRDGLLLAWKQT
ncbi:MAG TPA: O-methyltransferase [Anaerolineales bacterium]|nr:O-methyltransferase [Anaerolineales bacterium]